MKEIETYFNDCFLQDDKLAWQKIRRKKIKDSKPNTLQGSTGEGPDDTGKNEEEEALDKLDD